MLNFGIFHARTILDNATILRFIVYLRLTTIHTTGIRFDVTIMA